MSSSVGKRQREQQRVEKSRVKAERKAARRASDADLAALSPIRSESELIEDLSAFHRAFEAGKLSPEDFEERRDRLQAQLDQLS